jgi:hypothetical protein
MSEQDVRQAYDTDVMLTRTQYGELYGYKDRTMQRYLADGRIPGAVKDERGQWLIPAGAPVSAASASTSVVRQAAALEGPNPPDVRLAYPLGMLVPLDEAAAALGTSVGGLRRLAAAGHLELGPWGPNGALRVWVPGR